MSNLKRRLVIAQCILLAFVAGAIAFNWHPQLFEFSGVLGIVKLVVWIVFLAFLGYSLVCSARENIFRTIRSMMAQYWGRQIGIDLYIGLLLFMAFVFLHQGSWLAVALWLLPVLLFANLATLLYLAIYLESIVAKFAF